MNAAKKGNRGISAVSTPGQMLGNRFVGRQHEFLDDLMADIVFKKVSTFDPALVVIFQLDFRHVQFQSAASEPPFA